MKPRPLPQASLATALVLFLFVPHGAAHTSDVYLFTPGPLAFPNFLPPFTPPSIFVQTVTIRGVTADDTLSFGVVKGAGSCDGLGQACITFPTWNNVFGGVTFAFDCQITSAFGPWPVFPVLYLAQDVDSSGTIDLLGPDLVLSMGFPVGSPFGPLPFVGGFAGAYGGGVFFTGGGPFILGMPVHLIASHPGFPVTPLSALVELSVSCWVI